LNINIKLIIFVKQFISKIDPNVRITIKTILL